VAWIDIFVAVMAYTLFLKKLAWLSDVLLYSELYLLNLVIAIVILRVPELAEIDLCSSLYVVHRNLCLLASFYQYSHILQTKVFVITDYQ